jgi:hypothetical protein
MTTVLDTGDQGPGTHALVIGVGSYDHLLNGNRTLLDNPFGLKQLGSPPLSAAAFADWLINGLSNEDAPLASVEVVISAPVPIVIKTRAGDRVEIEPATMANIRSAADRWFARANTHDENVAVFYHCGHGLESSDLALLAQDFGAPGGNPPRLWGNAYNFHRTYRGMANCKAKGQFFFVDACRQVSADLLDFDGRDLAALIEPRLRGQNATRNAPILYASARAASAFARTDSVSRFTAALIEALDSNGAERQQGRWQVSNTTLGRGVIKRIELGNAEGVPSQDCLLDGESAGTSTFHVLADTPRVPVVVGSSALPSSAALEFRRGVTTPAELTAAGPAPWKLDIRAGTYAVWALNGQDVLANLAEEWVLPPAYERDLP